MDSLNKEELVKIMTEYPECIAAICNEQEDYKKYVYETFVRPRLKAFGECNSLLFEEDNLFASKGGRGFYFHKIEWVKSAIWFYTDHSGEWGFYWGVSNYVCDNLSLKQDRLDCIYGSSTDLWPYGWEYLNKYRDWDMNTIAEMINGHYLDYITKLVLTAVEEIEKKGLPMP